MTDMLKESVQAFAVQEESMIGISPALQGYAAELQKLTNIGDEVTMKAMQIAQGMGVSDDKMQDVTKTAIALSNITGKNLNRSMKLAAQGSEGYLESLIEVFPAMRQMETEAEKQAFANEQLKLGYERASQGTGTLSGALKSISNNWGDILEKMGELIAPFIKRFADAFNRIAPIIQSVIGKALPVFQALSGAASVLASIIGDKLLYAFTFGEVAIKNWKTVVISYLQAVYANFLTRINQIKYFFTDVLPPTFTWFAENFLNIMRDMFVAYMTMWQNRIKQAVDMVKLLWDVVTGALSGGATEAFARAGEIAGRNMLDGFVATTKPFPKIAERVMGDAEQAAWDKAGKTFAPILAEADKKYEERKTFFKDLFTEPLVDPTVSEFGQINLAPSTMGGKKTGKGGNLFDFFGGMFGAGDQSKQKAAGYQALTATEGRLLSRTRTNPMVELEQKAAEKREALVKVASKTKEGIMQVVDLLGSILDKDDGEGMDI